MKTITINPRHILEDRAESILSGCRFNSRDLHTGQIDEDLAQDAVLHVLETHHNRPMLDDGSLNVPSAKQAVRHAWSDRIRAEESRVQGILAGDAIPDFTEYRHTDLRSPLKGDQDQAIRMAKTLTRNRRSLKAGPGQELQQKQLQTGSIAERSAVAVVDADGRLSSVSLFSV